MNVAGGREFFIVAEGQSEERFLKALVAPVLRAKDVYLKPQLLQTSRGYAGGGINFDRLHRHLRNVSRSAPSACFGTFFDLYALDASIPGVRESAGLPTPQAKAAHIEQALHHALVASLDIRPDRLIAHVQPYELEGLFFSDVESLSGAVPGWEAAHAGLEAVRAAFETPEHINDGYDTKPSARLAGLLTPQYRKTTHAPLIAERTGLCAIEQACPHFAQWIARLRQLP